MTSFADRSVPKTLPFCLATTVPSAPRTRSTVSPFTKSLVKKERKVFASPEVATSGALLANPSANAPVIFSFSTLLCRKCSRMSLSSGLCSSSADVVTRFAVYKAPMYTLKKNFVRMPYPFSVSVLSLTPTVGSRATPATSTA